MAGECVPAGTNREGLERFEIETHGGQAAQRYGGVVRAETEAEETGGGRSVGGGLERRRCGARKPWPCKVDGRAAEPERRHREEFAGAGDARARIRARAETVDRSG